MKIWKTAVQLSGIFGKANFNFNLWLLAGLSCQESNTQYSILVSEDVPTLVFTGVFFLGKILLRDLEIYPTFEVTKQNTMSTDSFNADKPAIVAVRNASNIFSSPDFFASVSVAYTNANTGKEEHADFFFNAADPEFKTMLNDWAARKMGELHQAAVTS